jgi:GTP-binding protein YchF
LSGKTTFFQTITESLLDVHALQKKDANLAVVKIPDERLDKFTEIFNPKKKVNATLDVIDVAGVAKTEGSSSGLSPALLAKIKNNDALIHVVRGFDDPSMPPFEGNISIIRDIKALEEEFLFSDMALIENRLEKLEKEMLKSKNKDLSLKEKEALLKWQSHLMEGNPLRQMDMNTEEQKLARNYQPLSAKPLLVALNLEERDVKSSAEIVGAIKQVVTGKHVTIEPFFAKIEMELAQLSPEEKAEFMADYGLKDSALSRLINAAYNLLGLQSFFTVGEDECRAWTIRKGMTAQEAAGVIHTDFYNKFIRAEVVGYHDFLQYGTFAKCKEHGVFKLEGKEYIVHDGDILHVRHG